MEDFEDIEFKPIDSGLGFHSRRNQKEENPARAEDWKCGKIFPREREIGSVGRQRSGWRQEGGAAPRTQEEGGGSLPGDRTRPEWSATLPVHGSWIKRFFINQFLILSIFFLLCSIPTVQFQLLKQPLAPLLQTPILASFGILLAVVQVFYTLFFKQFKLPSFGKWVIERKSKP